MYPIGCVALNFCHVQRIIWMICHDFNVEKQKKTKKKTRENLNIRKYLLGWDREKDGEHWQCSRQSSNIPADDERDEKNFKWEYLIETKLWMMDGWSVCQMCARGIASTQVMRSCVMFDGSTGQTFHILDKERKKERERETKKHDDSKPGVNRCHREMYRCY